MAGRTGQALPLQIGQELLSAERMPEICYCIIEGRGRVLHNDPGLQRPVTLAYAQPGDLIGWSGLARQSMRVDYGGHSDETHRVFSSRFLSARNSAQKAFARLVDVQQLPPLS